MRSVFGGRELAFEPVQQTVDDIPLTVIERYIFDAITEPRFRKDGA